jgi:trans-aconitate methyltransferase
MTAYLANPEAWQESWDHQQEAYLPDREHRFAAMLDAVDAATGGAAPRLLDLAGGTGTITLRTLARFPGAEATVLDQDPVLLAIAAASLRERASVVSADLNRPAWRSALPVRDFDAVLTATALHWLAADRVTELYAEIRGVLRPGGVFVNADQMPDDRLPEFGKKLQAREDARRDARYAAGAVLSWRDWWQHVTTEEFFRPVLAERESVYPADSAINHSAEWLPPVSWHVEALRAAGFSEAGVLWRGGVDAAVIGVR